MSENPFEAPKTSAPGKRLRSMTVDGDSLVVISGTKLPAICVKTNQPVSSTEVIRGGLGWCPRWVYFLILAGIYPFFLVHNNESKMCKLTYALSDQLKAKYRTRLVIKVAVAAGLGLLLMLIARFGWVPLNLFLLVSIVVAIVVACIGNTPLKIVKHQRGFFWVKGFSPEFLLAVEAGQITSVSEADSWTMS